MTEKNDGGPVFPQKTFAPLTHGAGNWETTGGITLRDWFAVQAISGACGSEPEGRAWFPQDYADWAYKIADAMLDARDK